MGDHISPQTHYEREREQQIVFQVQALHNQIGLKLFTLEVISYIHKQLFSPTSSNSINNEVLDRYMRSLGAGVEHRLRNELQIFSVTGVVSSYFVHNQELDTFAADELSEVVKEWENVAKGLLAVEWFRKESMASELQSRFDMFREMGRFEDWTQQNLKDLRASLAEEKSVNEERKRRIAEEAAEMRVQQQSVSSGGVQARKMGGKRKLSVSSNEVPEAKRAREFNDLYDVTPGRKFHPRAAIESIDETNAMDLS